MNTETIANPYLRRSMLKGLEFHQEIFKSIKARPNAPLGQVAQNMDEWITRMYAVTHGLDVFVNDPTIVRRLNQLADDPTNYQSANAERSDTLGLIVAKAQPDSDSEEPAARGLLEDVRKVVTDATQELDGSLRDMNTIQTQLRTTSPLDMNWPLAQRMNVLICDHMNRLERADELIESLFRHYCQEAQPQYIDDQA
jgi:hypothetical protein